MFQAETEDMLPRAAPKPSATALNYNEALAKPIVPEVSILFGQQQPQRQQQTAVSGSGGGGLCAPQSYAAWKKQVLPKVTFPAGADSASPTLEQKPQRTTLYPLRSTAAMTPLPNASVCTTASTNSISTPQPAATPSLGMISSTRANLLQHHQRRSLDGVAIPAPVRSAAAISDVLTICAGTQTEYSGNIDSLPMCENLATKDDVAQVFLMLETMREEQQRLREVCEALLMQPICAGAKPNVLVCDASTQYNDATIRPTDKATRHIVPPLMQQYIAEEEAEQMERVTAASTQHVQHVQKPIYPVAQSTAYRSNALPQQVPPQQATALKNIGTALSKPATEKSMVMTELALKYLPNEKLTELMQELEVSPAGIKSSPSAECNSHAPPLRGIENLVKSPNELSNASYKYLKKYRLLPEENCANHDVAFDKRSSPISTQPKVQSPLVANSGNQGENAARLEQLLDLERIRAQPKFL